MAKVKRRKTKAKRRPVARKKTRRPVARKKTRKVRKTGAKRKTGITQHAYALSSELQAVVGAKKLTRPQIVKKLWVYIKAHKCQDMKNKRMIVPDKKLSEVLGTKPVDMLKMGGLLNPHIKK